MKYFTGNNLYEMSYIKYKLENVSFNIAIYNGDSSDGQSVVRDGRGGEGRICWGGR